MNEYSIHSHAFVSSNAQWLSTSLSSGFDQGCQGLRDTNRAAQQVIQIIRNQGHE